MDPYGGRYATAGNPYIAADGSNLGSTSANEQAYYVGLYGSTDAGLVWAEDRNQTLLNSGQALLTSDGVISMNAAMAVLQQSGYTGPTDPASVASHYKMLKTPPPPTPVTQPGGGISLGSSAIGGIPAPVLVGGGVLLLLMLGGRRL